MWQESHSLMHALRHFVHARHVTEPAEAARDGSGSDIATEIRGILVFHLGGEEARLSDDARLIEDLGADELDLVEIAMSCEERFDIDIPNRVASGFKTVGDAVRFIEAGLAGAAKPVRQPAHLFSAVR